MKLFRSLTFFTMLWLAIFLAAMGSQLAGAQGLVAAYGFNEGQGTTTADASGNGLAGTLSNAKWVAGKFGNALQFTGASNSRVTVANTPLLQFTTAFTLSAWVNPAASQHSEAMVIGKEIPGNLPYVLYAKGSGIGPDAYVLINGNYQLAASANTIPANTWTHLAVTYDGATLSVYVNGTLAASTAVTGNLTTGSGALRIGNNTVFGSEGFIGSIDEVRVYNRAISAAEIQTDMVTPVSGTAPPPDTTPPTGTVRINGGAVSANLTAVTLALSATDNATGVAQMRFSNDGVNFSAPVAFATTASWALSSGDGAKTVSVQFRDGAGNWSNAFTAAIILDTTPPIGTMQINGGAATTNQAAVTLTLSASDNATGVAQMRFSNDGASFSAPVAFATMANWALSSGDGTKSVSVQFRDGAGNWSGAFTTSITLAATPPTDTTPPSGSLQINGGASTTSQPAVTLTLSATDDATGVAQMRFSNDGVNFSAPIAFATTASWVLTSGDGTKTVSVQFRDGAGNWSNAFTASIVLATGPTANPSLGAHVLFAQNDTVGTNPATTPAINTQVNGSTLLAISMGWLRNLANPVDNFGNTWSKISGPNIYFSPDFYTAIWAAPAAIGGNGQTLTFAKDSYPAGEISMALIEVTHGGKVDMIYKLAPASNQSPGSITVDGPATLIALWGGDAFALDNTAVPDNGFTVIDSYLSFGGNFATGVQVSIAAKEVTAPGTYTVNWTSAPSQNCACYLIAVKNAQQTPPTDTTPPTGSVQINGGAATTNQTAVTLTLAATDDASGVAQMRFSNDGVNFGAPVDFATTASWVVSNGDGSKTVSAQFRDGAGNWSNAVTASIALASGIPAVPGLVAAYSFNEGQGNSAADVSGNGLSGAVSNAAWVPGKFGNALQFSGAANSLVTIPSTPLLQFSSAFTLSAWINPSNQTTAESAVIAKEISGDLPYVLYATGSGGLGPNAFTLIGGVYTNAAASPIPVGTWTHVAATYNGSALSVYVNGVLAGTTPVSGNLTTGNGALRIGNDSIFSNEGYIGLIDEVRVYNRALSAAEILADMTTPVGGP